MGNNEKISNNTNRTKNKVKRWKTISIKWFVIWCLWIFLFFLLITFLSLYWILNNPDSLSAFGIESETIRELLLIFSIMFFGILFFFAFFLLSLNLYKFFTANKSKFKYLIWSIFWWILLLATLGFGTFSIISINNISWEREVVTNNLVNTYLLMENDEPVLFQNDLPLIAPSYFAFQLNESVFVNNLPTDIGNINNITSVELSCWNNQSNLIKSWDIFSNNWFIQWNCLYTTKKDYSVFIEVFYNRAWNAWSISQKIIDLNFDTEIKLSEYSMNDANNEIVVWTVPATVQFDASSLFTDLWLSEQNISWDLNWNGSSDFSDVWNVVYTYRESKLNKVYIELPDITEKRFYFDLRTQDPKVPNCNISFRESSWNNYQFNVSAPSSVSPRNFNIELKNIDTERTYVNEKSRDWRFVIDLQEWVNYIAYATYESGNWDIWNCQTDKFKSWLKSYEIDYSILLKKWSNDKFIEYNFGEEDEEDDETLNIDVLPTKMNIVINWTNPKIDWEYSTDIKFDWDSFYEFEDNKFEYDFTENTEWNVTISIVDPMWNEVTETIPVIVEESDLVPILLISPDEWEEPLQVNIDASASRVTVDWDNIVYYTWDLGDWEKIKNSSLWQINHTYNFDVSADNWHYKPCVTVITRKWIEKTKCWDVFVKRQVKQATIDIVTHPTQSANVWDVVKFMVNTDWQLESVAWNFWNWKTMSWEWRTYTSISTTYNEAWNYNIRVILNYKNNPRVVWNITLRVREK